MSSIKLKGSTSGDVTITVPAEAGSNTITIPATTGTMLDTNSVIASAKLPAGTILQVVQGRTKALVTTTSTSFVDTGLTATITPSSTSSKILVICNQNGIFHSGTAGTFLSLILLRGSTNVTADAAAPYLGYPHIFNSAANARSGAHSMSYLDSPSTTDATTYKVQGVNTGSFTTNYQRDAQVYSTIQLMEIAG